MTLKLQPHAVEQNRGKFVFPEIQSTGKISLAGNLQFNANNQSIDVPLGIGATILNIENSFGAGFKLNVLGTLTSGQLTVDSNLQISTNTIETTSGQIIINPNTNLAFLGAGGFGGGTKVIFIGDASLAPSSNPAGGGILYAEAGALKYRGSSGTMTTIADA